MYDKRIYDAWLASAEIPYDSLIPLLHGLKGSENVYKALLCSSDPLISIIPESLRKRMMENADKKNLDIFLKQMQKYGIQTLTIEEAEYPSALRGIPDPPAILFLKGNHECLKSGKKVAMIGSRAASYTGKRAARKIAADLSRNRVTVISGLAYGIDTESHRGCLEGGSPTIAVMGCGLDIDYPVQNHELKNEILEKGGLIISEYAPGVKPLGHHFPYRNRIISGLSDVVILVEAKIRSGSMTTVDHALKQGKEIYVYPGDPDSPLFEGNRMLLRDGAHYFSDARDILQDMDWLDNLPYILQNSECSAMAVPENEAEKAVYLALKKGDLGFDELMAVSGLTSQSLMSTLTVMQIRKAIEPLPGKRYHLRS